jgi:hypothetical protein
MKRTSRIRLGVILVIVLFSLLFLGLQAEAEAKSATPIEGAKFDVSVSLKDNFKSLIGKDVVVNLRSGKTHQGFVKAVGEDFVHLERLSGRDFYDALVRIADISSIELKFRDMK